MHFGKARSAISPVFLGYLFYSKIRQSMGTPPPQEVRLHKACRNERITQGFVAPSWSGPCQRPTTHRAQIKAILLAWGMPEDNAEATADILSWADLHGVDSHGMSMIPGYDRLRRYGRAKMDARRASSGK